MFGVNYNNALNCIALYRTVKYSGKVHGVPEVFSFARRDVSRSAEGQRNGNLKSAKKRVMEGRMIPSTQPSCRILVCSLFPREQAIFKYNKNI